MMTEKEKISEWICRYNEGDLHGEEFETFLRMVGSDRELQREVVLDRKINEFLKDQDLLEFRKVLIRAKNGSPRRVKYQVLMIAASLLILVTISTVFLISSRPGPVLRVTAFRSPEYQAVPNPQVDRPSTYKTIIHHGPFCLRGHRAGTEGAALAYVPLASLEQLCGESVRAESLSVILPGPDQIFGLSDTIRFEWRPGSEYELSIEIISNKGKVVASLQAGNSTSCAFGAGSLSPGLYYWKLIENGNLSYTGKFRIK
jgi:hypothetical protein